MRVALSALTIIVQIVLAMDASAQEPARLALLIGNKGYSQKVGALKNPHNDVTIVGASLQKLGFKVNILRDASYKQMDVAIKRHARELKQAGAGAIGFFYFSGHGVANPDNRINYLLPIDISDPDRDTIWDEGLQQNVLIDILSKQAPASTHFVVFDACRNELNLSSGGTKSIGSADKGFLPVQQTSGVLIAYSTAPNRTASDIGEGGGPYARVLAEELVRPGVEAVSMFRAVQIRVKRDIQQDPWLSLPALPQIYLAGAPGPAVAAGPATRLPAQDRRLLLTQAGLGPFGADTTVDVAAIREAFPGHSVVLNNNRSEGLSNPEVVVSKNGRKAFVVMGENGKIRDIMIFTPDILDSNGIRVGAKFSDIPASALKECFFAVEENSDKLICSTSFAEEIQYWLTGHRLKQEGPVQEVYKKINPGAKVWALRWVPAIHDEK
jgi:hypothetical protein